MKKTLPLLFLFLFYAPAYAQGAGGNTGSARDGRGGVPAGTLIDTPDGAKPIAALAAGGSVSAYRDGKLLKAEIKKIFVGSAPVLRIKAGGKVLDAAAEHPLLTRNGFVQAGTLKAGDELAFPAGKGLRWAVITSAESLTEQRPVYTLELGAPHTFIAGGFIVHNYYSGRGRSARRRRELR
ncbi:MAG TPA: Hint domain-containing protein, partial [Elusimicrobiales bacterium]|nr:Hint domain-containing protein [Elusimicrobiales bacterium]